MSIITYLSALSDFSYYSSLAYPQSLGQRAGMEAVSGQGGTYGQGDVSGLAGSPSQRDGNSRIGSPRQADRNGRIGGSGQADAANPVRLPGQGSAQSPENPKVPGQPDTDSYECETCKNRKYQDGSNDPGVSFKTPTRLSPERAAFAIRAHEAEHVAHARARAQKEDEEIVSQSVSYRTGICPECGRIYMAGGTTRTTFRSAPVVEEPPVEKGRYVDRMV